MRSLRRRKALSNDKKVHYRQLNALQTQHKIKNNQFYGYIIGLFGLLIIVVIVIITINHNRANIPPNDGYLYVFNDNNKIYTMEYNKITDSSKSIGAFCVDLETEKIVAVGNKANVHKVCDALAQKNEKSVHKLDTTKYYVLPGLIDTHTHVIDQGSILINYECDLTGLDSFEKVVTKLKSFINKYRARIKKRNNWVIARGWDQNVWKNWETNKLPTRFDLDKHFSNEYKIFATRIDTHIAWFNTPVINSIGAQSKIILTNKTAHIRGGMIMRFQNGSLYGIIKDNAMKIITEHIPEPKTKELNQMTRETIKECNKYGLTGVHDGGSPPKIHKIWKEYIDKELYSGFNLRVYGLAKGTLNINDYERMKLHGNRLTVNGVKFFMDGALGSWGAYMMSKYCDSDTNGILMYTNISRYYNSIKEWYNNGYQICTHAIGDKANNIVINKYSRLINELNIDSNHRFRIEHTQIISLQDIKKLAINNIIPIMQPTHATADMVFIDSRLNCDLNRFTKSRINGSYAWKSILNSGVKALGFGSDFPAVGQINPFLGLYAAVTRMNENGEPKPNGWMPWERVSKYEALKGYTIDAGYASFQDNLLGSINVGKFGDFILIDRDYFDINAQDILNINVINTYLGGKRVYSKE